MEQEAYFNQLQTVMQEAIAIAEQLREEARQDTDAAADWDAKTREVQRRCEKEADTAALEEAHEWLRKLRERVEAHTQRRPPGH